jgi:hypothetical protein
MKKAVCWVVVPCSLVEVHRRRIIPADSHLTIYSTMFSSDRGGENKSRNAHQEPGRAPSLQPIRCLVCMETGKDKM